MKILFYFIFFILFLLGIGSHSLGSHSGLFNWSGTPQEEYSNLTSGGGLLVIVSILGMLIVSFFGEEDER